MSDLKEQLGLDKDKPIPSNYAVPYFVHEDNMNILDQSHKRIERRLFIAEMTLFLMLVVSNAYWIMRLF